MSELQNGKADHDHSDDVPVFVAAGEPGVLSDLTYSENWLYSRDQCLEDSFYYCI